MVAIAGHLLVWAVAAQSPEPTARTNDEPPSPKGLIAVAAAEAKRTELLQRERIRGLLRNYAIARDTAADAGSSYLNSIVDSGADAVPILLEFLRTVGNSGGMDASFAGPIARALAAIFDKDQKKNVYILKNLQQIASSATGTVRAGVLEGMQSLDHLMVVEIVRPMLSEQDVALKTQVVRVLGKQKSSAAVVAGLLKPLLAEEGAPWAEVLAALQSLGDKGGLDAAQGWIAKSGDTVLLGVSIRYVGELGGKPAIPVLRNFVMHGPPNLSDSLLRKAIEAIRRIGMRDDDARKPAEDALVDIFKRHSSSAIRDTARWELGPFQNDEALKSLEQNVNENIKANQRSGRNSNPDLLIELAQDRLQFGQWGRALDALNKAESEDEKGLRSTLIEPLRAVAYCGDQKPDKAKKILVGMNQDDRDELLANYPVLEKMAKDPKYRDLFSQR